MLHTSFWRRIVIVVSLVTVLLSVLVSFGMLSHPSVAYAGINGQQLSIQCMNPFLPWLEEGYVTGKNQRGDTVTWHGSSQDGGQSLRTDGWWWIGIVYIHYRSGLLGGSWKWATANVPTSQPFSDYYTVKVNCT